MSKSINFICPECGKKIELAIVEKNANKSTKKREQIICLEKDYAYILVDFKGNTEKIIFDIEDIEKIKKIKWHIQNSSRTAKPYLQVRGMNKETRKLLLMTRYLLDLSENDKYKVVDHINHNTLDNRRKNLRIVSHWENNQNKLHPNELGGIYHLKENNKYKVEICKGKKRIGLGTFSTFEEAKIARLAAEKIYLNFA